MTAFGGLAEWRSQQRRLSRHGQTGEENQEGKVSWISREEISRVRESTMSKLVEVQGRGGQRAHYWFGRREPQLTLRSLNEVVGRKPDWSGMRFVLSLSSEGRKWA